MFPKSPVVFECRQSSGPSIATTLYGKCILVGEELPFGPFGHRTNGENRITRFCLQTWQWGRESCVRMGAASHGFFIFWQKREADCQKGWVGLCLSYGKVLIGPYISSYSTKCSHKTNWETKSSLRRNHKRFFGLDWRTPGYREGCLWARFNTVRGPHWTHRGRGTVFEGSPVRRGKKFHRRSFDVPFKFSFFFTEGRSDAHRGGQMSGPPI